MPVGRLVARRGRIWFEYDPGFLERGLELSPFKLPLRSGVFEGDSAHFDGLPGVFDDSLPDGWGRLLIDRRARAHGVLGESLGPLDRLALVGSRAMGALSYEPEIALDPPTVVELEKLQAEIGAVLNGRRTSRHTFDRLFTVGGSPHGARPKALVQLDAKGRLHTSGHLIAPDATWWLLKFPSRTDFPDAGPLEHAYALMARAAGIDVPRTRLLGGARGIVAIERFDRDRRRRLHMHTLAGLLHAPHTIPSLSYERLLDLTAELTRSRNAVAQLFRRACFNVLAHNRDDHSRNFSFLMDERGRWSLSPAYDLTFSMGPGGEHWMMLAGEGLKPTNHHLEQLGRYAEVPAASKVIAEVRAAVERFHLFAARAGVSAQTKQLVIRRLRALR